MVPELLIYQASYGSEKDITKLALMMPFLQKYCYATGHN